MSPRHALILVVVVSALNLIGVAFGVVGVAVTFAALAACGLFLAAWNERRRRQLRDALASVDTDTRNDVLVSLENTPLRAELLTDLDVEAPAMPLRSAEEIFRYPVGFEKPMEWSAIGGFALAGFIAVGWASDVVLSRETFRSATSPWYDTAGLIALLTALGAINWWHAREMKAVVRLSEEGLVLETPGRRTRRLRWADVERVTYGGLSNRLRLRGGGESISIGDKIEQFGRLLNLVLSRVPGPPEGTRLR